MLVPQEVKIYLKHLTCYNDGDIIIVLPIRLDWIGLDWKSYLNWEDL